MTGAVLVTGSSGNAGSALVRHLLGIGEIVVSVVRDAADPGVR